MKNNKFLLSLGLAAVLMAGCGTNHKTPQAEPQEPEKPVEANGDEYVQNLNTLEGRWRDSLHTVWADAFSSRKIKIGSDTMPIWWTTYGQKPSDGRSLFISLHGGGGAPASVNNQQWDNQKQLYHPAEGVYLCPRAITDTWDLHFRPESDAFYEAIIQMAEVYLGVNPNKVYVMGYSAGGDGVWRIAPRMADHWAAASMMAGHPGDVSLLSLRNTPFMIWCGAEDAAYDRNKVCAERIEEMDALQKDDPEGYVHEGHIVAGKPHWMDRVDTVAVSWMAKYVRNPYPKRVVWCQGDVMKEYFYWIGIPKEEARKGMVLRADIQGNTVILGECPYSTVRVFLSDKLVDLSKPVVIKTRDKVLFEGRVEPSDATLAATLYARNDPAYAFPCCVEVKL